MLQLTGVSMTYGSTTAVQPTDLVVPSGQPTVLIVPRGGGKSTLVRLMAGLTAPDTSTVTFDGETIQTDNARAFRQKLGFVVQDGGLFPHLSARGNATLMAHHLGWDRSRIEERLRSLAEL